MACVFEQHLMGGDRNFGYLLGDREEGVAVVIDPSYRPDLLLERAAAQGLKIIGVINTHGHHDHTNGNETVFEATGAPLLRAPDLPDGFSVGALPLTFFHTPGHADDHIVIYQPTYHLAFTGDHLFVGKIGGTASDEDSEQQYASLHILFDKMPLETTVWPGHDVGCRPSSTLRLEKETNPFLLAPDLDAFIELKQNWPSYKRDRGLL